MRIGLVCPYDLGVPGGVQQIVIDLARHLRDGGDDVVVVGPGSLAEGTGWEFRSVGASITLPANDSRAPICLRPSAWTRTIRALSDCQVIHVHEPFMPLVGWAALSLRTHPTVVTFHADAPRWIRRTYATVAFLGESALGHVTTTAVSEVAAGAVPRSWGEPVVIPNAIDVGSFAVPVSRERFRVAFLGRDEPRKGLDLLLEAWPAVRGAHPQAELVVMGAERPSGPTGVRYLGRVGGEEKRRMLASSAIYVAPNTGGESFGLVVAEGMAAGCAVVASDLDAFVAVLGDAGILVPVGDATYLQRVVIDLLADPERARRLGASARARAGKFDWGDVVARYRRLYEEALR